MLAKLAPASQDSLQPSKCAIQSPVYYCPRTIIYPSFVFVITLGSSENLAWVHKVLTPSPWC